MITAHSNPDQSTLDIFVDGQMVLSIDECSDSETINLFLYPINSGIDISEELSEPDYKVFELLANRLSGNDSTTTNSYTENNE